MPRSLNHLDDDIDDDDDAAAPLDSFLAMLNSPPHLSFYTSNFNNSSSLRESIVSNNGDSINFVNGLLY